MLAYPFYHGQRRLLYRQQQPTAISGRPSRSLASLFEGGTGKTNGKIGPFEVALFHVVSECNLYSAIRENSYNMLYFRQLMTYEICAKRLVEL
uniref:Uncharacterized protein n=1 Tax=Steinernema glaseri TaxID=37863 RepID=A0A1I7YV23_9BILA